jgi:hypothetical protein
LSFAGFLQKATFFVFLATAARTRGITTNFYHGGIFLIFSLAGSLIVMQIRYATNLSAEQYVQQQGWKAAKLNRCPLHPQGGCGFCKNGSYMRKFPDGAKIARWYCADGHMSFSLLPDCLASRLSGSLIETEDVLTEVENSPGQEAAAENIRIDIILPSALRWIRRRIFLVKVSLSMLIELLPELFADCNPSILSFQLALNVDYVLPELRKVASSYLPILPPPLGFGPRPKTKKSKNHFQHKTGTDPPSIRC